MLMLSACMSRMPVANAVTTTDESRQGASHLDHWRDARLLAVDFWKKADGRWLDAETAAEFRDLARACSNHYEIAFSRAPDKYVQLQIAADWMKLHAHAQFDSDSQILRSAISNVVYTANDAKRRGQVFRAVFSTQMTDAPDDVNDQREDWMHAFDSISNFPFPEEVITTTARDLAECLRAKAPLAFSRSPAIRMQTMRWYLWQALLDEGPSPDERRQIDRQFASLADQVARHVARIIGDEAGKEFGRYYSGLIQDRYNEWQDNRFYPYFRRIRAQYESKDLSVRLEQVLVELETNFQQELITAEAVHGQRDERIQEIRGKYASVIFSETMTVFTAGDRPGYSHHLPDGAIYVCFGRIERDGLYYFRAEKVREWYAYPEHKPLTIPEDRARRTSNER